MDKIVFSNIKHTFIGVLFIFFSVLVNAQSVSKLKTVQVSEQQLKLDSGTWNGCKRYNFKLNNREAIVVVPHNPLAGKPWVVRPAFFDAFAYADSMLINEGFYVCYYDVTHLYGSAEAQALFSSFYEFTVNRFGLSPKVTLEGFSRGGLFCLNWAANNAEKVACMYLDAPVCNVNSWPRKYDPERWQELLQVYNTNEKAVSRLKISPVDKAKKLAHSKIPMLIVAGDADRVVPFDENGGLLMRRMKKHGASVELILKPGVDHHPHSLTNPSPIVDFIKKHNL